MSQRINLDIHKKLSLLAGFSYPMPEDRNSRFTLLWRLYVIVPYGFMLVELVSQAIQISLSIDNVEALTTCTLSSVYIVQYLSKVIVFRTYEKTFERIFQEMSAISRDLMENPFEDDTYLEYFEKLYNPVMKIGIGKGIMQFVCNLGLNILFCVLSWVGRKPKITAAYSWTPYDSSTNPGYTLTCLFEMIAYGSVTARTGVFDLLFWVMLVIPRVQLNYLKHLMDIMLKDSYDYDVKRIHSTETMDSAIEAFEEDSEDTTTEEILALQMNWWIKMHQRVLRMVWDFKTLASPFLAVNFVATMIDLFMSGFVAISESQWDTSQRVLINAIIMVDTFQLYVISVAGDWLRESSEDVTDTGLSSLLFRVKRKFRKDFLFVLARSRKILSLRFGGIYLLSTETFMSLIQLTLTYFITVIQIKNSQKSKETTDQLSI